MLFLESVWLHCYDLISTNLKMRTVNLVSCLLRIFKCKVLCLLVHKWKEGNAYPPLFFFKCIVHWELYIIETDLITEPCQFNHSVKLFIMNNFWQQIFKIWMYIDSTGRKREAYANPSTGVPIDYYRRHKHIHNSPNEINKTLKCIVLEQILTWHK